MNFPRRLRTKSYDLTANDQKLILQCEAGRAPSKNLVGVSPPISKYRVCTVKRPQSAETCNAEQLASILVSHGIAFTTSTPMRPR